MANKVYHRPPYFTIQKIKEVSLWQKQKSSHPVNGGH